MSAASTEPPRRLIVDAGPLIALMHSRDSDHDVVVAGFLHLARAQTQVLAPLPVVYEVYKWLLQKTHLAAARFALQRMRDGLEIIYPGAAEFNDSAKLLTDLPSWNGTLEDALIAFLGLRLDVPVWTLNFRELAAFRNLHFWTPEPAR